MTTRSLNQYTVLWAAEIWAEDSVSAASQAYASLIEDPKYSACFTIVHENGNQEEVNLYEHFIGNPDETISKPNS